MDRLLRWALANVIRVGNLRITTAAGSTFTCGDGTGRPAAIRFTTAAAEHGVLINPQLRLGEAYMDGGVVVERGTLADVLAILQGQASDVMSPVWARVPGIARSLYNHLTQLNLRPRSRRNVAHHYDLDAQLYALFLDADRQYSCAYFENGDQSLDDAQLAKKRHLAAKLLVGENSRVLDIGSGWYALAQVRASEKGLTGKVEFRLQDYRDVSGKFDRIVSVGMFEHVGVGFYDTFFRRCHGLLDDQGVMLLHSIGRSEGPSTTNPWIAKYIFPGGYIPALSEVLPKVERSGLLVTDIEILRLHYAETLKAWRERFLAHREQVERLYDERFVRMWEFYLAASEMAFREQNLMVFQMQLTKRQGIVPTTRGYVGQEEARLRRLEDKSRTPWRLAGE